MAVRGINPFERHIEKIFLAVAAAGLTGVVAWQLAGGSGTVKVGAEELPADKAYDRIRDKARQLADQMRKTDVNTPEALNRPKDLLNEYQERSTGPVAPSPTLAFAPPGLPPELTSGAPGEAGTKGQYYLPPKLAGVVKPIAHPFMSTVHDADVTTIEGLAKFMPAAAPFDKAAVSVETTIDPKAVRAGLEQDPDGDGPAQPLLRNWWAG
ncbi:MAG TPA: hypothetical protein VEB22_11440, partial [Phycisphaerales bacterium]|nr:hypothetical protein [Phycisphaerales bacterium]